MRHTLASVYQLRPKPLTWALQDPEPGVVQPVYPTTLPHPWLLEARELASSQWRPLPQAAMAGHPLYFRRTRSGRLAFVIYVPRKHEVRHFPEQEAS